MRMMNSGRSLGVCAVCLLILSAIKASATVIYQNQKPVTDASAEKKPHITGFNLTSLKQNETNSKANFTVSIEGENLCKPGDSVQVQFLTADNKALDAATPACQGATQVTANGEAAVPTQITSLTLLVNGTAITSSAYKLSITQMPPPPAVKQFQITFDHQTNAQFPNLHSVLAKKQSGDAGVGFAAKASHMQVELIPTGPTDMQVTQSSEQQMDLHFIAAADYKPTQVVVTVYDGSDLDTRKPVAVAVPAPTEQKPAQDPSQPQVSGIDVLFLERSQGRGRIRINGKGFGDHELPPYPVDDYLSACLQWPSITSKNPGGKRAKDLNPECKEVLGQAEDQWPKWEDKIRHEVSVSLTDRNTDLRIEKTYILNVNDALIDVYFEFTRYYGYSEPFRLKNAEVNILKSQQKTVQTLDHQPLTATVTAPVTQSYTVQSDIGPKTSSDLSFDYTVLDKHQAGVLFGKGIAENFFVLKISAINNGQKKISIPLAGIQAEVEWARGSEKAKNTSGDKNTSDSGSAASADESANEQSATEYLEGPPTVTPSPLGGVSAYFDAYNKSVGKRARLFNMLDALTTAGALLVPYTGPSFKDAQVFWSGGFVPAVHKGVGDISGQQLQNLTTLSWQNAESVPPQGGSVIKYVYIQKHPQVTNEAVTIGGVRKQTKKAITNLMNLDITGFEIQEGQAQSATKGSTTPSTTPSSSGTAGGTTSGDNKPAAGAVAGNAGNAATTSGSNAPEKDKKEKPSTTLR